MDIISKIASDSDMLIITAAAFILWKSGTDTKLILALAYIFLFN